MENQKPPTTALSSESLLSIIDKHIEGAKKAKAFDPNELTELATSSNALRAAIDMNGKMELPNPNMQCVECNYARWITSSSTLKCRCKEFHEIVWTNFEPTYILVCDSWQPKPSFGQE